MSIIDKIVKKLGTDDVIKFSDKDTFKDMKSWVSTGLPELEYNLGVLGLPMGIVEIAGVSRSGKTTFSLVSMKNFLDKNENGIAVILSSENRDNKEYAKKLGIDVNNVIIIKVRYVEEMFLKVKSLINNTKDLFEEEKLGKPKFFFMWDSLGATLSKSELDVMEENVKTMEKKAAKGEDIGDLKSAKPASFAKEGKMFAKFILGEMYETIMHFVILNHVHDQIRGKGGKKSGGGGWVEFLPCIRLRMSLIGHEQLDDVEVAQYSEIKTVKNDFGSRKKTIVEILLGHGFVLSKEDIAYGISKGIIKKEGALKLTFGSISWKSKRTFYDLYLSGNKVIKVLEKKITQARHKDILSEKAEKE